MDSRSPGLFAAGMGLRAAGAAGLFWLLIWDLAATRHYATALVLLLLLALLLGEAAHRYARAVPLVTGPQASLAQAAELDQMTALLDAVTVALVTVKADGRIRLANRAARLLAGEEVGRLSDLKALGVDAVAIIEALPVGARQIVTMADGRPLLVWVGAIAVPGQPAQKLVSLQAVTGELDAVQLKAWMDMTRVLSHEIMNSLTPISSLSESLRRMVPAGAPETADALAAIARRSQELMSFVERYRVIADLPSPAFATLDAAAFLADIDALTGAALAARNIAWTGPSAPPGLMFQADPALLSQALINLLRNAADAAAAAPAPRVALTCVVQGDNVVFHISDNGLGIAPERREEVFLPFFTTKAGGSGIGLTLARQIVLAHGGRIALTDTGGGGATFRVVLPARPPAATAVFP